MGTILYNWSRFVNKLMGHIRLDRIFVSRTLATYRYERCLSMVFLIRNQIKRSILRNSLGVGLIKGD